MTLRAAVDRVVATALEEDLGQVGDLTTLLTVPATAIGTAYVVAREEGVLSGCEALEATYAAVDPDVKVVWERSDGDPLVPGAAVASVSGSARSLLTGERVSLNLLGHLSGVATRTRVFTRLVEGTGARIVDTRKTTPGLRALEKAAVRHGGGVNHRFGLHDAILVKDNHIGLGGGLSAVLERLGQGVGHMTRVEVEVDTLDQLDVVLAHDAARVAAGLSPVVHTVMLDNMGPALVRDGVARVRAHVAPVVVEVSGGVTEAGVRALAEAGADVISVGALTHSVRCLDLGLDLVVDTP